ncbi:hypothetical protein [Clostridium sardiniense]|uniref:hypothetical protein n=1 Tax=Clostridium sardiniense TaxID=29369 RepID=UPI003D32F112
MKKNKIVAFAMAGALLVGGTFAGTKAWFTDSATEKSDLVITTGNIDVDTITPDGWLPGNLQDIPGQGMQPVEDKETEADKNDKGEFTNVRPGDKFYKRVRVENKGSLSQKLNASGGEDKVENDSFKITNTAKSDLGKDRILAPGEATSFYIEVEVLKETGNDKKSTYFNLEDSMNPIVITAEQKNS